MRYSLGAAALSLLSATTVLAQNAPTCPDGLAPVNQAMWQPCTGKSGGRECATIYVPKDYSDSSQGSIPLRLVRLPASDSTAGPIKSVIVNPGGPGGSGIETVLGGTADTLQTYVSPCEQ